jgi:hypothetical protein
MEIFDLPDDNIDLPNENIDLPEHVCHGRIGTSAWFFPFTTDYLPVRTMESVSEVSRVSKVS